MSTALKWVIAVIVLAILAWLLWWSGWLTAPKTAPAATTVGQATTTPQAQPLNGMTSSTDTSDAAMAQDASAIDTQMQGYNTDTANVDSSMNDKAVSQ